MLSQLALTRLAGGRHRLPAWLIIQYNSIIYTQLAAPDVTDEIDGKIQIKTNTCIEYNYIQTALFILPEVGQAGNRKADPWNPDCPTRHRGENPAQAGAQTALTGIPPR